MKKESGSNWSLLLILRFGYGVSPADLALLLHCIIVCLCQHGIILVGPLVFGGIIFSFATCPI